MPGGGYRLAYRVRALFPETFAIRQVFLDARTGFTLLEYDDLHTQTAGVAGRATGVLGDQKKISVQPGSGGYVSDDKLRPPVLSTYDFRFSVGRFVAFLNTGGSPGNLTPSDLGTDNDNVWTDGAVVDAHVYAGYTYDYYFKRHGRRGLDNANIPIRSVTHMLRREDFSLYSLEIVLSYFANASYLGDGVMMYGDGLPPTVTLGGQRWNYLAGGLDVVGHELTHGVTDYSSRLIYQGESGALNEAFSDMMGTATEFFFQPEKADYAMGEDVITPGGIRSMQNPTAYGDPDHYSVRFTGSQDGGGVHINSGIPNHAFYLAIEGGTHRLGGVVRGVGGANREQVEKVFYRAFTSFLSPSATFAQARAATLQAARELYGVGSAPERAVTEAWTAVGVN
jgi:thermolysin